MDNLVLFLILILILFLFIMYRITNLHLKCQTKLKKKNNIINGIDEDCDLILDNLYLGNINASKDIHFLKDNNIKYIFNISNDIPNYYDNNKNIIKEYINLKVRDDLTKESNDIMFNNLPNLVLKLDNLLSLNNGNVLVHCYAGRQRSAVLVAAYLIYKYNLSIKDAYNFILERRPEAFHYGLSYNFNDALTRYYDNLNKI